MLLFIITSVACRQYPVKHYIKEAKRLKHKADAEVGVLSLFISFIFLNCCSLFNTNICSLLVR